MRELVVISGKGGTGKTSILASFALLAERAVIADCDVDAADLHLILSPEIRRREPFQSGREAVIRKEDCTACGQCLEVIAIVPVSGNSRSAHRRTANEEIIYRTENWPSYRSYLQEQLGSDFVDQMRGGSSGYRNPPRTEWHHPVGSPDVVWLVRRCEHRDPGLQDLLHPEGVGGYSRYYGQ